MESAVLAPPIVRPIVTSLEAKRSGHVLLYATTGDGDDELVEVLGKFAGQEFIVYGYNKSAERGNCVFKERSTEGFLSDLASCRGVVASAGFSLLSECMYLKKRMLLLPLEGQYEQIINARYVEELGLGVSAEKLSEEALGRFLEGLDEPMPEDCRVLWPDNDGFFRILQGVFDRLDRPVRIEAAPGKD